MTLDEQEAESNKYALGIRVLKLSSGSWAYFKDFQLTAITPTLEVHRLEFMLSEQILEYETQRNAARKHRAKLSSADLLKELGL